MNYHPIYSNYYYDNELNCIKNNRKNIIKPCAHKNGYYFINVCLNGKIKHYSIHRFIYECVHGIIPPKMEIDHIDDNRANNNISNLQLLTHQQNCKKSAKNRDYSFVKNNHKNKHLVECICDDGTKRYYNSLSCCSKNIGVNTGIIKYCCDGKNNVKSGISKIDGKKYKFSYFFKIKPNMIVIYK